MEAKELLKSTIAKLQELKQEEIKIKDEKAEIMKGATSQGLNSKFINKTLKALEDTEQFNMDNAEFNCYLEPFQMSLI